MSEAKKGYSIWSLMVITTLLAVWFAVPRRATTPNFDLKHQFFIVFHQVALWTILASGCWLISGRRKVVLLVSSAIIVIIWSPMLWTLIELACYGRVGVSVSFMDSVGLTGTYQRIYYSIRRTFGYDF